jgi:hypothetical protein
LLKNKNQLEILINKLEESVPLGVAAVVKHKKIIRKYHTTNKVITLFALGF